MYPELRSEMILVAHTAVQLSFLKGEIRVQRAFQNNDAKPVEELKPLDGDASKQLESRLSIDDQYV